MHSPKSVFTLVTGVMLILASSFVPSFSVKAQELPDEATVMVAEDVTAVSECILTVREKLTGQQMEKACDPGSVVDISTMTYEKVKERKAKHYVALTGNEIKDKQAERELIEQVRKEATGGTEPVIQAICATGAYTIGYSAIVKTSSNRVAGQLNYYREATCAATRIVDRAREEQGDIYWYQSSINGQRFSRGVNLTTAWSAYYNLPDSAVGQR